MKDGDRYWGLFGHLRNCFGSRIFYPCWFLAFHFLAQAINVNAKARGQRGAGRQKRGDDIRINHRC